MKEIVIKIDNTVYNSIVNTDEFLPYDTFEHLLEAVKNGTELPKGHERLIDESKITSCEWNGYLNRMTTNAPTIIEADKEGIADEKLL